MPSIETLYFNHIVVKYETSRGTVHAVNTINGYVHAGESVGLVGESGCGKSSLGRALVGLEPLHAGEAILGSLKLTPEVSPRELKTWRKSVQLVFQDPNSSLNPRHRISEVLGEVITAQLGLKGKALTEKVIELMEKVGLNPETRHRYPHQFSGGQRQRIGIARALATGAQFLVLDEPVSALDVSVQAQIINLLKSLQTDAKLGYLFVSHDLAVVENLCQRTLVMYLGHIVESGPSQLICTHPKHPYTQALVSAVPTPTAGLSAQYNPLQGELPSPMNLPIGCPFVTRCQYVQAKCHQALPELREIAPEHFCRCTLYDV